MAITASGPGEAPAPPFLSALPVAPGPEVTPGCASWSHRVAAAVLDHVVLVAVAFLTSSTQPVGVPSLLPTVWSGGIATTQPVPGWALATAVAMLLGQAYLGVTPGKIVLGIAVVGARDGRPIGLVMTLLRTLAHLVDSILMIGYLRPLWHPLRRTFADSIVGSVVLATHQPRAHRGWWTEAVDPPDDPGPPLAWERLVRPGWTVPTARVAAVVCVVGVLFAVPWQSSFSSGGYAECTVDAPADGAFGITAVSVEPAGTSVERRLWVERPVTTDPIGTVTWTWAGVPAQTDEVVARVTVSSPDGSSSRTVDQAVPPGFDDAPGVDTSSTGSLTIDIPHPEPGRTATDWEWSLSTLVDGIETPVCGATFGDGAD